MTTRQGLQVTAHRITRPYARVVRISDEQMAQLELHPDAARSRWNYEIRPTAAIDQSRAARRYGVPRDRRPLHPTGARYRMIIGRTLCYLEMSTDQSPLEKVISHCPLCVARTFQASHQTITILTYTHRNRKHDPEPGDQLMWKG